MDCCDRNGTLIKKGERAKVQIKCGEPKTGVVTQINGGRITIRCEVTDYNPDGVLFSAEPSKTVMLD